MPKIKTNRMASKKFRKRPGGTVKRAQANTSHNTGKKAPKARRQLRAIVGTDKNNMEQIKVLLPNTSGH